MNYYLMINNHPPLIVYNDTKNKYYEALGNYDKTGKIDLFVDHMKVSLETSWELKRPPEHNLENFLER